MNKQEIQVFIESKYPQSISKITDYFKASSAEDFKNLMIMLNQLEDEYLIARNEKDEYLSFEKSMYRIGDIKINQKGFGFVDLENQSYFVPINSLYGAMNNDEVLIKINYDSAEVIKVLKHKTTNIVLEVDMFRGRYELLSLDRKINGQISVTNLKDFKLVVGYYVECHILKYYPNIEVEIKGIIGHKNDPGTDIQAVLLAHNISSVFPKNVLEEADALDVEVDESDLVDRTNHLNLLTFTIDGEDAKDLDDAVSIERLDDGYLLYVHIADVSHYVVENSAVDKEAKNRGTSVYVADKVVPMLPQVLSNGICSLNPKELRLTLTCKMHVDNSGYITDYHIYPSYIRTICRMSYSDVNAILDGKQKIIDKYLHLVDTLKDMDACAKLLRHKREVNGSLDFARAEAKLIFDAKGRVKDVVLREQDAAEQLIEDFMVSANVCVATQMKNLDIPALYRVHPQPKEKKILEFKALATSLGYSIPKGKKGINSLSLQKVLDEAKGKPVHQVLNMALLRSMAKAVYDANCTGHFGLGLEEYLHFTSPIRRYPDLIVHRNLRKYLFNQNYDVKEMEQDNLLMEELGRETSQLERNASDAEYEVLDMKKAEYMLKYVGQLVTGIISSVTKFGFYVELPNTVEGLVHISTLSGYYDYIPERYCLVNTSNGKKYSLGQEVSCLVKRVSKDERLIEFEIVEKRKEYGKNNRRQSSSKSRVFPRR